jgi:hypothetical protein
MKKRFYLVCTLEQLNVLGPLSLLKEHYNSCKYLEELGYILPFNYSDLSQYQNEYICLEYEEIFDIIYNPILES